MLLHLRLKSPNRQTIAGQTALTNRNWKDCGNRSMWLASISMSKMNAPAKMHSVIDTWHRINRTIQSTLAEKPPQPAQLLERNVPNEKSQKLNVKKANRKAPDQITMAKTRKKRERKQHKTKMTMMECTRRERVRTHTVPSSNSIWLRFGGVA